MFVFTETYEFDWPVRVTYPGAAGERTCEFTARFRLADEDEIGAIFFPDRHEEDGPRSFSRTVARDRERLSELIVGWSGVHLEGGGELPFSPENLAKLLRQRPIRLGLGAAAVEALIEGGQRAKNSAPPPAP